MAIREKAAIRVGYCQQKTGLEHTKRAKDDEQYLSSGGI